MKLSYGPYFLGYERKTISNVIYKLTKLGKIKTLQNASRFKQNIKEKVVKANRQEIHIG